MTTDLQARLLKVLATRKAAHARWYVAGEDTSKNRAECKALGEADDALELFVHAECYDIADEIARLTDTVERLEKYKNTILEEHFEMAEHLSEHASPNEFAGVRRFEGRAQAVDELVDVLGAAIRGDALTDYQGDGK